MISPAVYQQAESDFLDACRSWQPGVACVLIYGSSVRGEVNPGHSDLLDATVLFEDDVLRDEQRFGHALEAMAESCRALHGRGVPFHPFHYFSVEEALRSQCPWYLPAWQSGRFSKVALGRDLRPFMSSVDPELAFARGLFAAARRSFHEMARFLEGPLEASERREALAAVASFVKHGPVLACLACGLQVELAEAARRLAGLLPDLGVDAEVWKTLKEKSRATAPDPGEREVRGLVSEALRLVELIHAAVTRKTAGPTTPLHPTPASQRSSPVAADAPSSLHRSR